MKILTWNVNGIRTLIKYHPWNTYKSYKEILRDLDADIICFQEIKCGKSSLDRNIAIIEGWDSYFSFPISGKAYSGVAIYNNRNLTVAKDAQEGITGILSSNTIIEGCNNGEFKPSQIDSEGRALIIDYGMFVLINLYCPHESSDERRPYRMAFLSSLESRIKSLLSQNREIIIVGDINICRAEMDHVDPKRCCKDNDLSNFGDHPARKWFNKILTPNGNLVDLARHFFPTRENMYTCWNTKINARGTNYGTRIDYILASKGLLNWVKMCDIQPNIYGSDHCPVIMEFHDEIHDPIKGIIKLSNLLCPPNINGKPVNPPRLAAIYTYGEQGSLGAWVQSGVVKPIETIQLKSVSNKITTIKAKPLKRTSGQTTLGTFFQTSQKTKESSDVDIGDKDRVNLQKDNIVQGYDDCLPLPSPSEEEEALLLKESELIISNSQTTSKWGSIFQTKEIPHCKVHNEPGKEYTCNKPGPNQGRRFWLCSRPVGKGYDNGFSKTPREDVNHEYKCNFFLWSTQRKRKREDNAYYDELK